MILGNAIGTSPIRAERDVIDVGEVSAGGNTIIRAGTRGDNSWQQSLHIVLTPTEREQLITVLKEQRSHADILQRERSDANANFPLPIEPGDVEGLRVWAMHGDYSQVRDPWYSLIVEWESERRREHNG